MSEPLHTLTLTIHDGCGVLDLVCPHEGQSFTVADDAPECRWLPHGGVSETCMSREAFGAYGDDCIEVDDNQPFQVSVYPIPITCRWDGDEFYVKPAAVSVPGQEGKS